MTLKQMYNSSVLKKLDDAEAKGKAEGISQGIEKVFALLERGISLTEAKRILKSV
ncbi:MAG: hypothetical protein FWB90_04195 [Fibromonadales bacterium]|nr:hypothetical protein [Fibromonadales bacterium]